MANKSQKAGIQGVPSALSNEVRAAGYSDAADKLEIQNALHRVPESGQHTELSTEEYEAQQSAVLDFPEEIKAVQGVEYGTYVATEDIFFGSALAYAIGHPVPVSNVESHGYEALGVVRRVNPPQAKEASSPQAKEGA